VAESAAIPAGFTVTTASIIAIRGLAKTMAIQRFSQIATAEQPRTISPAIGTFAAIAPAHSRIQIDPRSSFPMYSRRGVDTWMNVGSLPATEAVETSARGFAPQKRAGMELVYIRPYIPNRFEFLILANRRILTDQMGFLKRHVAAHGPSFI
jgi:hypothetical protein